MPKNFIYLGVEFLVAKVYVNSCIALLNAQYYTQSNADNLVLLNSAPQGENFPTPRKNAFKHAGDEVAYPAQSAKWLRKVTIEMDSFSSV
ncbi:uncharacterized protein EDB91DRAFT_1250932 [Suillus paluster]|uniref:uncharacterized protein n=1 Tax=Suillus paluster TaxID=48578 RepID=UPI001B870CA8|nr:uncharacterized protein EDB91DRAFT_1250932 [Suillus paluster]KAG1734420.1 hypothetical protein EDB91DRAFT_1250932 [Suillus paluster]